MELVFTDAEKIDKGTFTCDIDIEIGDDSMSNDFEMVSDKLGDGYCLYAPGTEWGGMVEYLNSSNEGNTTFKGHTWRGLLMQSIIEPPAGSDYKIVSGEANNVIRNLLSNVLGGFFIVPETDSGLIVSNYQFPLYCKVGTGIMNMLSEYGYRLWIHAEKEAAGEAFKVYVEAVTATRIEGEYNSDNNIQMRFINNQMGINHLVCMGKGDLQNRQRIDLYVQADGSIGKTKHFTGFKERIAYYDYSNAESMKELENGGRKRLSELKKGTSLEMDLPDQDYEIGDMISGRDREHGLFLEKAIVGKILRRVDGAEEIEYKVEGD